MDATALLTDDEIVALCAADGRAWPITLPTVEATAEDLAQAGIRGMRSLMVRRLAGGPMDQTGLRPNQMIASDVAAFLGASDRVGAYVAPASDHSILAGAAITAARASDGWVVDTATAAGVHALRLAAPDEAVAALLEFVEQAHKGTLFANSEDSSSWVCVLRFGPDAENLVVVGSGSASGVVDGSEVDTWDSQLVRDAFGEG